MISRRYLKKEQFDIIEMDSGLNAKKKNPSFCYSLHFFPYNRERNKKKDKNFFMKLNSITRAVQLFYKY